MKHAFDRSSIIKTLRDGLNKSNPENPNLSMWTLEDLDHPAPFSQDNFNDRRKALKKSLGSNFQEDVHMPKYQNLLREPNTDVVQVEVIDPHDFSL